MRFGALVRSLRLELETQAGRKGLAPTEAWNVLVVAALRQILAQLAQDRGLPTAQLARGRLFRDVPGFEHDARAAQRRSLLASLSLAPLPPPERPWHELPVEAFGQLYEALLAARPTQGRLSLRKQTGSYYTPELLTQTLVLRALETLQEVRASAGASLQAVKIVDPALGAGAFLIQAGRQRALGRTPSEVVRSELYGADISPLAVAVAEASLWLFAGDAELGLDEAGAHLREGDALCEPGAAKVLGRRGVDFSELSGGTGFDLVIGNPPWVAFAGRATQPLEPALRAHYRRSFRAFSGYPTLHALFVELSARHAPRGAIALLIPSPLSDLDGYRPVRRALAVSHRVCEPLLELGQDAFESVTQPCFALVAAPRREPDPELEAGRAFVLSERRRAASAAGEVRTPPALARLAGLPRFPEACFGEMGLQTNSAVSKQLLYRGVTPPPGFSYPLLEGRNVAEFQVRAARLFLKPDAALLSQYRCRLRASGDYARVKLVVRQTAAVTIAAAHDGTPFRNSLLAGFELSEVPFELTLGLLNSTLYRALHLAARRDARQGAFPQVKIAHLRALPLPTSSAANQRIAELAREATRVGFSAELRAALDRVVFAHFEISDDEAHEIRAFVKERTPRAGLASPLD